jgi:hypothetical protein
MFHESYGEVTRKQLAIYRKFNVSPADHDLLVEYFGDNTDALIDEVIACSTHGYYRPSFY